MLHSYTRCVKLYTQRRCSIKSQPSDLAILPLWNASDYDNHCKTKNLTWPNSPVWWQTYIVPNTDIHNIMTIENFCKYNFHNDHVITKITKIFYYENLEPYGIGQATFHIPFLWLFPVFILKLAFSFIVMFSIPQWLNKAKCLYKISLNSYYDIMLYVTSYTLK